MEGSCYMGGLRTGLMSHAPRLSWDMELKMANPSHSLG